MANNSSKFWDRSRWFALMYQLGFIYHDDMDAAAGYGEYLDQVEGM